MIGRDKVSDFRNSADFSELVTRLMKNSKKIGDKYLDEPISAIQLKESVQILINYVIKAKGIRQVDEADSLLYKALKAIGESSLDSKLRTCCERITDDMGIKKKELLDALPQENAKDVILKEGLGILKYALDNQKQREIQEQRDIESLRKMEAIAKFADEFGGKAGLNGRAALAFTEIFTTERDFQRNIQALLDARYSMLENYRDTDSGFTKADIQSMLMELHVINEQSKAIISLLKNGDLTSFALATNLINNTKESFLQFMLANKTLPAELNNNDRFFPPVNGLKSNDLFSQAFQRFPRYELLYKALADELKDNPKFNGPEQESRLYQFARDSQNNFKTAGLEINAEMGRPGKSPEVAPSVSPAVIRTDRQRRFDNLVVANQSNLIGNDRHDPSQYISTKSAATVARFLPKRPAVSAEARQDIPVQVVDVPKRRPGGP